MFHNIAAHRLLKPQSPGVAPCPGLSPCSTVGHSPALLDQLVGTGEQRGGNCQAERLCRLKVDNELKLCWLLDGKVCRLGTSEDPVNVSGCAPIEIGITDGVANEPTGVDEFSGRID